MCVSLFTTTSLLCSLALNLGMLVFLHVLQGVWAGGLAPVEQGSSACTRLSHALTGRATAFDTR